MKSLGRRVGQYQRWFGFVLTAVGLASACSHGDVSLVAEGSSSSFTQKNSDSSTTVSSTSSTVTAAVSPAAVPPMTTMAVVDTQGRVVLVNRQSSTIERVLYTPAIAEAKAEAVSLKQAPSGQPTAYIAKSLSGGCSSIIRIDSTGNLSDLGILGGGPVLAGEDLIYVATSERNETSGACRATGLVRRNLANGAETRWDLSVADQKKYSGLSLTSASADAQQVAFLLSSREAGSDIGVLDLTKTGTLLDVGRVVPRPTVGERLSLPHFAGGKLYTMVSTFDPSGASSIRRLVVVNTTSLSLEKADFTPPATFQFIQLDPSGTEYAWSDAANPNKLFIANLGGSNRRELPVTVNQPSIAW